MLLSVDLNGCIKVLHKGYFPKLFFRKVCGIFDDPCYLKILVVKEN